MTTDDTPTQPQASTTGSAPAPTTAPAPGPGALQAPPLPKTQPRSGPIVAGTLLLVLCAYAVVHALGGTIDATAWIITTVIGLGAILLIVGVVVLARGSRGAQ